VRLAERPVERVTGTAAGLGDQVAVQVLSIAAATEHAHPPPAGHIPLTRNEIAALFSTLIIDPVTDTRHRLHWSTWRRRRQHRAKTCHYQRQARQS
jgi:hypothetical protein